MFTMSRKRRDHVLCRLEIRCGSDRGRHEPTHQGRQDGLKPNIDISASWTHMVCGILCSCKNTRSLVEMNV